MKVRSSNILSHAYDEAKKELTVTFHGGRAYRYSGVPKETAQMFARAKSLGKFLYSRINGKFKHELLG